MVDIPTNTSTKAVLEGNSSLDAAEAAQLREALFL